MKQLSKIDSVMDASPAKKRKTSLTTSIAVSPKDALTEPVVKDGVHTTPNRASFMSPTKASLARFNPELLQYPRSTREEAQARDGKMFSAAPRRRSHTPGRPSSPAKSALVKKGTDTVIPASSFESPEEIEEREQENATEHLEHELQANAPRRSSLLDNATRTVDGIRGTPQEGEPELPLTPTQLGLEPVPEPPKGLLFSSPSRRVTRRKGQNITSSPLKPRNLPPMTSRNTSPFHEPQVNIEMQDLQRDQGSPEDVELTKTREICSQLSLQLKYLQDDVIQLEAEVNRSQDSSAVTPTSQNKTARLISILASENPIHSPVPLPPKPVPLSLRLSLFLPFSRSKLSTAKAPTIEEPPRSHHPVQPENPLSYLRAFTPLNISSTESLLSSSTDDTLHLRQQEITFASSHNLLMVKLSITTNTITHALDPLTLVHISPWADSELGGWIRKYLPDGDISSIGYSIGRYWEIASIRARCWRSCRDEYQNILPSAEQKPTAPSPEKQPIPKRKGRQRISTLPETVESESNLDASSTSFATTSNERLADLSQQSFLLSHAGIALSITWRIDFDWTGEVESHISACASFPAAWSGIDERASLGKVGEVFEKLVVERGFRKAVGVVVALLFEDER